MLLCLLQKVCLPRRVMSIAVAMANLRTKFLDFRGLDSSIILSLRDLPESLSQGILVGIISVGRLGVAARVLNQVVRDGKGSKR